MGDEMDAGATPYGPPSPGSIVRHCLLSLIGSPTPSEREEAVREICKIVDALEVERDGWRLRWQEIDRDNVEKSTMVRECYYELDAARKAIQAIYAAECSFCEDEQAVRSGDTASLWWVHPDPDNPHGEPDHCAATRYRNIVKKFVP